MLLVIKRQVTLHSNVLNVRLCGKMKGGQKLKSRTLQSPYDLRWLWFSFIVGKQYGMQGKSRLGLHWTDYRKSREGIKDGGKKWGWVIWREAREQEWENKSVSR